MCVCGVYRQTRARGRHQARENLKTLNDKWWQKYSVTAVLKLVNHWFRRIITQSTQFSIDRRSYVQCCCWTQGSHKYRDTCIISLITAGRFFLHRCQGKHIWYIFQMPIRFFMNNFRRFNMSAKWRLIVDSEKKVKWLCTEYRPREKRSTSTKHHGLCTAWTGQCDRTRGSDLRLEASSRSTTTKCRSSLWTRRPRNSVPRVPSTTLTPPLKSCGSQIAKVESFVDADDDF